MNDRKRLVALVVPSLTQGGGVPAVARFVKDAAMRSGRYDVRPISLSVSRNDANSRLLRRPSTWRRGPLATMGEWEGLAYTHVGANWGELEFQRYRPRAVLRNLIADCDVVQVVCGSPAWANPVLESGKPVSLQVATLARVERRSRDAAPRSLSDWWRRAMTRLTDRFDDRALRLCDAIQVENLWMYDYVKTLNGDRPMDLRYAPPGVDTDLFKPLPARDLTGNPYILCVGRLSDPRKNIELLGQAFVTVTKQGDDTTRLLLAGNSAPPAAFWQVIDEAGLNARVTYLPGVSQTELIKLYQRAAVFALPSDEEGLGVVVLEAMACGVPVVSTRSGGPDGIIRDGTDGLLIPLHDSDSLAFGLNRLLTDAALNLHMGQAARQRIDSKYSIRMTAQAFVDTWERLLWEGSKVPGC